MEIKTTWQASRVNAFLRYTLPAILSGKVSDPYGIAKTALLRAAKKGLELAHKDFQAKSLGGQGDDGITWEPLSEYTIEQRQGKTQGTSGQASALTKNMPVDLKAMRQSRQEVYSQEYRKLRLGGLSVKEARRQAAITAKAMIKAAWQARAAFLKMKGMEGKPGPSSPEDFPILNETGRLLASLAPGEVAGGLNAEYTPPSHASAQQGDQEIEVGNGEVSVVSNVPYGEVHMSDGYGSDTGGFRPARPWKYGENVPESWMKEILEAYSDAVMELLPEVIRKAMGSN